MIKRQNNCKSESDARRPFQSTLGKHENWARVHFIPNLKDGEFVTLRAPYVLNGSSIRLDLDDKTGKDSMGRWVAVLFLPEQDGTLVNFNRMLVDSKHACIWDFRNNEFDPLSWWNGTHPSEACKTESNKNDSDDCADAYNSKCSDGPIVCNAATARYHHPCCPHSRDMNLSDAVWFISSQDAIDQGYLPCEVCCLQ